MVRPGSALADRDRYLTDLAPGRTRPYGAPDGAVVEVDAYAVAGRSADHAWTASRMVDALPDLEGG